MIVGIKFIPLRTPGGELIPGSGLFVQIKKTVTVLSLPKTTDGDVWEITQDQRIGGQETTTEDKSYCTDEETTLTEDSFEMETANHHERIAKREEELRSTRRRFSTPASVTCTNGHFKQSVRLNVIAEVNDDAEEVTTANDSHSAA